MREEISLKFDEETSLKGYIWKNESVEQIGTVQIAHGLSEHVSRYDHFANYLANNGFVVIAADHYGHGESAKSPDKVGQVKNYDFIDAVIKSIKLVREEHDELFKGIKCLFGHSMGSIASQEYIQRFPNDYDKIILSGTDVGDFKYVLLKLLTKMTIKENDYITTSKILNNFTFRAFEKKFKDKSPFNWLSKNVDNINNYINDPLCGAPVPDKAFRSLAISLRKSFNNKNIKLINPNIKVFIFSGSKDPVSAFGKSVNRLYKKYRKNNINVYKKIYNDLRHETLNEKEFQIVYDDVLNFINN